jgi:lysophospholipase L1-like esterase
MKKIFFIISLLLFYLYNFAQIKVSCIGTSITAGYGIADSLSYPGKMQNILGSDLIGNFGVSASTILHQTNSPYINTPNYINAQSFNPNIVTIEFGTNDSQPQNWNNYQDSFVTDYTRFISVFKALPTHPFIYVCLPIPALSSLYGINDSLITYTIIPLIKLIAANTNVKLIDFNTPFKGHPEYYQSDGIHPNATGAKVLAKIMSKAIAAPFNLTASVVSTHSVKLNWLDDNNETGVTIQRSNDSIKWKLLVKKNASDYTDSTVADSEKYFYRISAIIPADNTVYSNVVSTVTSHTNALVPSIKSKNTASGTEGVSFHYTIKATNNPTSYAATGLPQGLILNTSTGNISGKPVISQGVGNATFIVMMEAANSYGTITKGLKIYIASSSLIARSKLRVENKNKATGYFLKSFGVK